MLEILRTYQVVVDGFSRDVGIPVTRLLILRARALSSQDKIGIMDIARGLGVNAAAITRQLSVLESDGLVVREPDSADKRRVSVQLTPEGSRLFETLHRRGHMFEDLISADVTSDEIATTIRVLSSVRAAVEKAQATGPSE
jgi:DNA-binding MarR family transcriptional regulator